MTDETDPFQTNPSPRNAGMVRPFLGELPPAYVAGPAAPEPGAAGGNDRRRSALEVRPFLLTRGRVRSQGIASLEIEAQVITTESGEAALQHYRYEQHEIVALCREPMAVAEVAAQLGLHLGVARVLVGDLVACGHLSVRRPEWAEHRNVAIIERVIRGLQSIR
jgi:hypothetical protein